MMIVITTIIKEVDNILLVASVVVVGEEQLQSPLLNGQDNKTLLQPAETHTILLNHQTNKRVQLIHNTTKVQELRCLHELSREREETTTKYSSLSRFFFCPSSTHSHAAETTTTINNTQKILGQINKKLTANQKKYSFLLLAYLFVSFSDIISFFLIILSPHTRTHIRFVNFVTQTLTS